MFPISRDPPEGGTSPQNIEIEADNPFPISRDPPEGGTTQEIILGVLYP